jgi:hypothetical protein
MVPEKQGISSHREDACSAKEILAQEIQEA